MSRGRKKEKRKRTGFPARQPKTSCMPTVRGEYERVCALARGGNHVLARQGYELLERIVTESPLKALIRNDLATLAALNGDVAAARQGFRDALALDAKCQPARDNLALLNEDFSEDGVSTTAGADESAPAQARAEPDGAIRVALVSFLFNWPTRGGGNVHTFELAKFLARAGYAVRHFFPRFPSWGIGTVQGPLPFASEALEFAESEWNVSIIQDRFRRAVEAFGPDCVLLTDSWNMKPLLAEAMRGYPYFLRFQALECLCPLNNVRLLVDGPDRFAQCPRQQLATPDACRRCVQERGHLSGSLHQAERELAGVGTPEYHAQLCRALEQTEAVLVLNPFTEAMLSPYAKRVCVVPWGMDPARFPWPPPEEPARSSSKTVKTIFQAGVVDELMKGFRVLHAACAKLWQKRQDFELVATGEPAGRVDAFTRFLGWITQEELPRHYRAADIVAVPTIAQEGLSRTSVEAMAAGRPIVASRIGGIPATVADGATGLLCEPGNVEDLARKLEMLLDDAELRQRMGLAGRRRFGEEFTWEGVIERYYKPLLCRRKKN